MSQDFDDSNVLPNLPKNETVKLKDGTYFYRRNFLLKPKRSFNDKAWYFQEFLKNGYHIAQEKYLPNGECIDYLSLMKRGSRPFPQKKVFDELDSAKKILEGDIEKDYKKEYGEFDGMGRIKPEEIVDFHNGLDGVDDNALEKIIDKRKAEEFNEEDFIFPGIRKRAERKDEQGNYYFSICFKIKPKRKIDLEKTPLVDIQMANGIEFSQNVYSKGSFYGEYITIERKVKDPGQKELAFKKLEKVRQDLEAGMDNEYKREHSKFERMGEITFDEQMNLHFGLEKPFSDKEKIKGIYSKGKRSIKTVKTGEWQTAVVDGKETRFRKVYYKAK